MHPQKLMEPIYFTNRSGAVAVSFDNGETLYLPTNRVLDYTEMWQELSEPAEDRLNEFQLRGLARFRERQAGKDADKSVLEAIVQDLRDGRKAEERFYEPPERQYRKLPDSVLVVVADFD